MAGSMAATGCHQNTGRGDAHLGQQRCSGHHEASVRKSLAGDPAHDPLGLVEVEFVEERNEGSLGAVRVRPERGGDSDPESELDRE